ncbi:MAG: hypothetical protein IPJ00_11045 [Saprospirales bacterium]|nr:hypothetical protein [Saprospirales bacterium]
MWMRLGFYSQEAGETTGKLLSTKLMEAYIGTKIDPGGDYDTGYKKAHAEAVKLDRVKVDHVIPGMDRKSRVFYFNNEKEKHSVKVYDY